MVDKILIWIDELLWYFGVAKYIKDNHDCEISAIYDVNKNLKDIFKNQNFVNPPNKKLFSYFSSSTHQKSRLIGAIPGYPSRIGLIFYIHPGIVSLTNGQQQYLTVEGTLTFEQS